MPYSGNEQMDRYIARNYPDLAAANYEGLSARRGFKRFARVAAAGATGGASEMYRRRKAIRRTARRTGFGFNPLMPGVPLPGSKPRRFSMVPGMVRRSKPRRSGAVLGAWDAEAPSLGKSWIAKRVKVTAKTFAKLKPSPGFIKLVAMVPGVGTVAAGMLTTT